MIRSFALFTAIFLAACSNAKLHPKPIKEGGAILSRGWSYTENSATSIDAGAQPLTYGSPVLEGDRIVFGSERFGITVLHKSTGQVLWQKKIPEGVSSQPLIVQKTIYVGADDGTLRALDFQSGKDLWQISLGMPAQGSPILAADRLVIAAIDQSVYAVDPSTGKILWTYKRPLTVGTNVKGGGNPSYINGGIWIGFSDGSLLVLDPNDGSVKQERQFRDNVKFTDINAKPVAWREGVLVPSYDGKLRYMKRDLTPIWEFPAGGARAVLPSTLKDSLLFLPSSEGSVYAIQGDTGKEAWRFSTSYGTPTGIALLEDAAGNATLVIASSEHKIYAVDANTGRELGQLSLGRGSGSFSSIAVDQKEGNAYILSHFSRIHQCRIRR